VAQHDQGGHQQKQCRDPAETGNLDQCSRKARAGRPECGIGRRAAEVIGQQGGAREARDSAAAPRFTPVGGLREHERPAHSGTMNRAPNQASNGQRRHKRRAKERQGTGATNRFDQIGERKVRQVPSLNPVVQNEQ